MSAHVSVNRPKVRCGYCNKWATLTLKGVGPVCRVHARSLPGRTLFDQGTAA